jgi:hypothetical protein
MSQTWEQLELPTLLWVLRHGDEGTGPLPHKSDEPFEAVPELSKSQVAEAIARLEEHGLVAGSSSPTMGHARWSALRPTADGLRVLGEWPPADPATVNIALAHVLRAVAGSEELPEADETTARRAAEAIESFSGEVVLDVVKAEVAKLIVGGGA